MRTSASLENAHQDEATHFVLKDAELLSRFTKLLPDLRKLVPLGDTLRIQFGKTLLLVSPSGLKVYEYDKHGKASTTRTEFDFGDQQIEASQHSFEEAHGLPMINIPVSEDALLKMLSTELLPRLEARCKHERKKSGHLAGAVGVFRSSLRKVIG